VVVHPSIGNFLLVETGGTFDALANDFLRRGVILRPMGSWGYPLGFRVSVGLHEENVRFLAVLDELIAAGVVTPARLVPAPSAS
jgi:histidinol-phosphate aminotransferase